MKNYYLAMIAIISFISCSTENESNPEESNLILGTWSYQSKYQGEDYYPATGCDTQNTIKFSNDSRFHEDYFGKDSEGNCYDDGDDQYGTWDMSTNELTLYYEDMFEEGEALEDTFEIEKLTENELVLRLNFDSGFYHIIHYSK